MIKHNRKIVAVLVAVALFGGALLSNSQPVKVLDNPNSAAANTQKTEFAPQTKTGNSELFFKMMLMVLLVAVLGVAAIYVSKKIMPKLTNTASKRVRVLESAHLGARKTVHLIKIDNRLLLIGSTSDNMIKLCDMKDACDSDSETEKTEI